MSYFLFLDDIREVKDVTWVNLPSGNWHIVRNYQQFVDKIEKDGMPYTISFDHDLATEHYSFSSIYKEKTGADCARWLVNYCIEKNLELPKYTVHSMNPVGADNIKSILISCQKFLSRE